MAEKFNEQDYFSIYFTDQTLKGGDKVDYIPPPPSPNNHSTLSTIGKENESLKRFWVTILDPNQWNLSLVLQRLEQYGLRANLDKCQFSKDQINYCGHVIDKAGLHTSNEKTNAVENAPTPENVSQLRSFLGLVNYYSSWTAQRVATEQQEVDMDSQM
uniref:Retrovirus-related Pol polyprotein from transposon 17.6 n=1 Tax=Magallana gigas TaxID=29159 RepID=K1R3D1_MAGGI